MEGFNGDQLIFVYIDTDIAVKKFFIHAFQNNVYTNFIFVKQ